MKKQLISFDSPKDPDPSYCEAIDCDYLDLIEGCLEGKEERECAEEAEGRGEKLKGLIKGRGENES